jgi:putative membrane protein
VPGTRLNPGAALVYSITACFATTLAGIYIAFSATTTDQQVAGLIMWVPCCIIYLTAALAVVLRTMRGANAMVGHEAH